MERHIRFPIPAKEARKDIFRIHTGAMKANKIDVDKVIEMTENLTGADIRAVCTEAGYFAIREERASVETNDFINAIAKVRSKDEVESTEYVKMFG